MAAAHSAPTRNVGGGSDLAAQLAEVCFLAPRLIERELEILIDG